MALPELIEIVPLDKPVRAEITVPGSKSITNRALILAALAGGETILNGALWSEDTQIMVECLQELGFMVNVEPDPNETCNRTITVYGDGGRVPPGGTESQPLELFVGNAGTAARFLAAFVCLGKGFYRLHGTPRMHERPQAALFQALRELGYRVDSPNDKLPATIFGGSSRRESAQTAKSEMSQSRLTSAATVSIEESSQFASALLLCAKAGGWKVEITGENAEESPYVAMTAKMIEVFPKSGGKFQIEPDASSGSYFRAVGWFQSVESHDLIKVRNILANVAKWMSREDLEELNKGEIQEANWQAEMVWKQTHWLAEVVRRHGDIETANWLQTHWGSWNGVVVKHWPASCWQVDNRFFGLPSVRRQISRKHDLGDSIMTAIVIAPFADHAVQFTDLGRLRVQETERVVALRTELTKCGAKVVEEGDTLTVYPSQLHGAEIETYNDHRMAMCFAVLGLKVPGIKIKNPACVKKTFPNFFQKLAGPPPAGLGGRILDGRNGRTLTGAELFAE
jgi:3-phosphoshikimate 1-carboxyvinyltransferase